jgi:hypothetical protein
MIKMNRRKFVGAGATALTSLAAAGLWAAGSRDVAMSARSRGTPLYKVIFDTRFQACRAFAAAAGQLDCRVHGIAGDVTALWYDKLQPRWSRGEGMIAGMTTTTALFCLEQLAWNHWMRVVARIEHRPQAEGVVRHHMSANAATVEQSCRALAANANWEGQIALQLVTCAAAPRVGRAVDRVAITSQSPGGDHREPLVSWIISA